MHVMVAHRQGKVASTVYDNVIAVQPSGQRGPFDVVIEFDEASGREPVLVSSAQYLVLIGMTTADDAIASSTACGRRSDRDEPLSSKRHRPHRGHR